MPAEVVARDLGAKTILLDLVLAASEGELFGFDDEMKMTALAAHAAVASQEFALCSPHVEAESAAVAAPFRLRQIGTRLVYSHARCLAPQAEELRRQGCQRTRVQRSCFRVLAAC